MTKNDRNENKNTTNNDNNNNNKNQKVTGVYYDAKGKKYRAQISVYGKKIRLGSFQTEKEAIEARKQAEKDYDIESYKVAGTDLGIAHFALQFVIGMPKDYEHYRLFYDDFALPALLFVFLNEDDLNGFNFFWKAIDQIKHDVENRLYHPVFNPAYSAYQYDIDDIRLFVDFMNGYTLRTAAKKNGFSYSSAYRRMLEFKEEMGTKLS